MSALLIVDPENDFVLTTGALSVPGAQDAIPIINLLRTQNEWDVIVVTADRHPANHCSFQVNNPGSVLYEEFTRENGKKQVAWPIHCVKDTDGARIVDSLKRSNNDWHVYKGQNPEVEQYSAFEGETVLPPELAHIAGTNLATLLKEHGITKVTICGFATDFCVYNTALDAKKAGFETDVFLNACRGVNQLKTMEAIADMKAKGIYCGTEEEKGKEEKVKEEDKEKDKDKDKVTYVSYIVRPIIVALVGMAYALWYKGGMRTWL